MYLYFLSLVGIDDGEKATYHTYGIYNRSQKG
jgi:hypothetical protein